MISKQIREDGTISDYWEANGTHLIGEIKTDFVKLVKMFGEPMQGDGYKVDAEWHVMTPAGIATIYNYKDGINYMGPEGTPVEDITDWHVGGKSNDVLTYIYKAFAFNLG